MLILEKVEGGPGGEAAWIAGAMAVEASQCGNCVSLGEDSSLRVGSLECVIESTRIRLDSSKCLLFSLFTEWSVLLALKHD